MKRKVMLITGTRADFGHRKLTLKKMIVSDKIEPYVVVANMHLIPEFGDTIRDIEAEGIPIHSKVYSSLAGYTDASMVKSLGILMSSLADIAMNVQPDIMLCDGDRGEQLMLALVGAHMNIPVVHLQGGDISGNIDGMVRYAITSMSHLHLVSNSDSAMRLVKTGEEDWRVRVVGSPHIDELVAGNIASVQKIETELGVDIRIPTILVLQHPVTEQWSDAEHQMTETIRAVKQTGMQSIVVFPNNDAGSVLVQKAIEDEGVANMHIVRSLPRDIYAGLLARSAILVGNSSSGLIEAPTFCLPVVNIGRRQDGRLKANNVIDVPEYDSSKIYDAIIEAASDEFRESLYEMDNPYGDGRSSERVVKILEDLDITEKLLFKRRGF